MGICVSFVFFMAALRRRAGFTRCPEHLVGSVCGIRGSSVVTAGVVEEVGLVARLEELELG